MAKVSTNINLDAELKKKAQMLFADFGMDLTTAVTVFLTQSVREQKIPFEIRRDIPNETTKLALSEYEEMINNPDKYKRYDSFSDALKEVL
ncbi:MAG: type II toxin-antitoxin system RelB/DinJ family antitoxin [Bacilli bacterium]|nr:type II toxin-antitoxin system RelB/DinJ family antitoxin [Bacilli bacterium]